MSTAGRSFDDNQSDVQSPSTSAVSPQEHSSISPTEKSAQFPAQTHRQPSDLQYMNHSLGQSNTIPPHMRHEYPMNMNARHVQLNTSLSNMFPHGHNHNQHSSQMQRNNITSILPTSYGPSQSNGAVSTGDSPHLSSMVWPSPGGALPSPSTLDFSNYPDPGYHNHMFFPGNNMRRPQSTEPEDWSLRSRHASNHAHFGNHIQLGNEWNVGMNMNVSEVKSERAYAM